MMLMLVPLLLLYEISIGCAGCDPRRARRVAAALALCCCGSGRRPRTGHASPDSAQRAARLPRQCRRHRDRPQLGLPPARPQLSQDRPDHGLV